MSALKVRDAVKRRGAIEVLKGLSLGVEAGERVALLGANGAGKTTLIRAALGLTELDGGAIEVAGAPAGSRAARAAASYLPEAVAFHGALTAREQLRHFARLKGEPPARADALLERVGLAHAAERRMGGYSKGMRQRVGLAQALLGRPRVALLDEPTSGLDPLSRHEFYRLVGELADEGTAVMLSSHALTELEAETDRIAILAAGRLVAEGPLRALRARANLPIRIDVTAAPEAADEVAARLGGTRMNGRAVALNVDAAGKIESLGRIAALGPLIEDVEMAPASLEDLYRHLAGAGELNAGETP